MTIKIGGADTYATNKSGNNYVDSLQVTAAKAQLHLVSFSPLAGMAADVYAWIYDLAAGTTSSAAPVAVRFIPAGLADGVVYNGAGDVYVNGIYIVLSSVAPTDGTTTPAATLSGNNKVLIKCSYRNI